MRILLDDTDTGILAETVGSALSAAATMAQKRGRMIVEVFVDGIAWCDEDLASVEFTQRGASELRLCSAHPAQLLRDTFMHSAEAVLNAEEIQRNAAKLMQGDRVREGFDQLLQALTIWSSVQTAVTQGISLGIITRDHLSARGINLDGSIAALDAQLRTLRDAMTAQDTTAVSDCLLYEFPATSRQFAATLADLAKAVDAIHTVTADAW